MVTISSARDLSNRIIAEIDKNKIDRIIIFGSLATKGMGNDIDIIVIIKNSNDESLKNLFHSIKHKIVTPFIKQESIGVDLFVWDQRCPGIYHRYLLNRSANIGKIMLSVFFEKK